MSTTTPKRTPGRTQKAVVRALLDRQESTYLAQAGIRLRNTPAPLYQALVLAVLLSARIRADIAVAAGRALFEAGMTTPRSMAKATWQQRVDALGEGGYRRYDESTATMLGDGAELLIQQYSGDLRNLREEDDPKKALRKFPGLGPTGVDIFLRGVQTVWPEFAPYVDSKALQGAERLGLPTSPGRLASLVSEHELARFTDGLVHVALEKRLAEDILSQAKAA
ncbi:endonuclease [Streptomyces sp. NPDC051576]|uniref:endonuclease n=1 Tax=Streptomyces sp. NPDC051576 TaxID=3155803 RepID=UPI003445AB73